MKCKECAKFITAPGMKWGACKVRMNTTSDVKSIIKGPDADCWTPQFAVKKDKGALYMETNNPYDPPRKLCDVTDMEVIEDDAITVGFLKEDEKKYATEH